MSDDKRITIEFREESAKRLIDLTRRMKLKDERETISKALALLMVSIGHSVEVQKEHRETLIIRDFLDVPPLDDDNENDSEDR